MSKARISKSGSRPDDYTVEVDGHDVTTSVRGVRWWCEAGGMPRAELELSVMDAETVEGEVEWFGLERVPTEALRDELDRREET